MAQFLSLNNWVPAQPQLRGNLSLWVHGGPVKRPDDANNSLTWNVAHDEDLEVAKLLTVARADQSLLVLDYAKNWH